MEGRGKREKEGGFLKPNLWKSWKEEEEEEEEKEKEEKEEQEEEGEREEEEKEEEQEGEEQEEEKEDKEEEEEEEKRQTLPSCVPPPLPLVLTKDKETKSPAGTDTQNGFLFQVSPASPFFPPALLLLLLLLLLFHLLTDAFIPPSLSSPSR